MKMLNTKPSFEISGRSCFPINLDRSHFINITCVGDYWEKYLDTETNKVNDCKFYYEQSLEKVLNKV